MDLLRGDLNEKPGFREKLRDERYRLCFSKDPVFPACRRRLLVAAFGVAPDKNPRCKKCRKFERLFGEAVSDLEKRNTGHLYLELNSPMQRELFFRLTRAIEPDYLAAIANGGDAEAERLWPAWTQRCHLIAGQFEHEKRSGGLFPVETGRNNVCKFLYLGAWFESNVCAINEGFVFGKTSNLLKRWGHYNSSMKHNGIYWGPLCSWDVGNAASSIEREIKSKHSKKREILAVPYDEAVGIIEEFITAASIPISRTQYWGQLKGRSAWKTESVKHLINTYLRRPDAN